jgi:O-antigen/teichoic acid export membrane protein
MTGRAALTVGSRAAVLLVLLVSTPFVVAALGPDAYGIWVVVVAIAGLYGVVDGGFAPALGRLVAAALARDDRTAARELTTTACAANLLLGILLGAIAWLLVPSFAELLGPPPGARDEAELAIRIAVVTGVAVNAAGVLDGALIGLNRIDLLARVRVAYAALLAAQIAVVLARGGGVAALAAAQLAAWTVAIALAAFVTRRAFGGPLLVFGALAPRRIGELLRFGLPPQASRIALIGALQYERLIVAALVGAGAAAGYGVASLLVGGLRALMGQAVLPLLPALTTLATHGERQRLDGEFARSSQRLAVAFAATFGVLAAVAPLAIDAWVGAGFEDAVRYTWILCAGFAVSALATTGYALAQAVGRPGIEAASAGVGTAVYVVAVAGLVAWLGAAGAAIGTTAGLVAGGAYCFVALARGRLARPRVLAAALGPLVAGAVVALPFALASAWLAEHAAVTRPVAAGLALTLGGGYVGVLAIALAATGQLGGVRSWAARAGGVARRWLPRAGVVAGWAALLVATPALVAGVAVWPALTVLVALTGAVGCLAWRAPPYAFVLTLLLFGSEGVLKLRVAAEGVPLATGSEAVVAALLDLCLALSAAGVLAADRLRTPRRIWRGAGRLERAGLGLLALWLVLSLPQLAFSSSIADGLGGLRLSQLYAVALPVAAVAFCQPRERVQPLLTALLAAFGLVAGYAALRVAIGPSSEERVFALAQDSVTEVSTAFRAVGSFSGSVGLESYLVPLVGFCLVLALLTRERRYAAAIAALGGVALVGSYGRAALVAVVLVGLAAAALLLADGRMTGVRRAAIAAVVAVGLLGVGAGAVVAGAANDKAGERARGLLDPLGDRSMQMRLESWGNDLEAVGGRPFGQGLGVVGDASGDSRASKRETDNAFLKVLVEQGIPGGLAFALGLALLWVGLARRLLRCGDDGALGLAALLGVAGFLVLATTGEFFEQPGKVVAWALLGIALGQAFQPARRVGGEPGVA